MTTTSRSLQQTWDPAWATAPPASCSTLRNLNGGISWGERCVFAQEDGGALPFSVDTACMPWITGNSYPPASAFYSPATACPHSWTAVATQGAGEVASSNNDGWLEGERGLQCCPEGFEADGSSGCRLSGQGTWPMVECGDADVEENEMRTYDAAVESAKPSVTALMLRYQSMDVESSAPETSETGLVGNGKGDDGSGMANGAVAAIATVVPLALIVAAIVAWIVWRRRWRRRAAHLVSLNMGNEKNERASGSLDAGQHTVSKSTAATYIMGSSPSQYPHETPEWNMEMDATETERQQLVNSPRAQDAVSSEARGETAELGGMMRVPRKPIAPVEIDGMPVIPEVGDAYIPYRPGAESLR